MILTGIILFSGPIHTLLYFKATADAGLRQLGIPTRIGGVFFILGRASLLLGTRKKP